MSCHPSLFAKLTKKLIGCGRGIAASRFNLAAVPVFDKVPNANTSSICRSAFVLTHIAYMLPLYFRRENIAALQIQTRRRDRLSYRDTRENCWRA